MEYNSTQNTNNLIKLVIQIIRTSSTWIIHGLYNKNVNKTRCNNPYA